MTQTAQITPQKVVSLEGLPEGVAQAFALMVEAWRKGDIQKRTARRARVEFAVWPGKVMGNLTRREIYEHL